MSTPYHCIAVADVLEKFEAEPKLGLSEAVASAKLSEVGKNRLQQNRVNPAILLLKQVANGLTVILTIATVLSFVTQQWTEGVVVLIVIISNVLIGFIQEFKSVKKMGALLKMAAPQASVLRDGTVLSLPTTHIVPGDIVIIRAGSIVPADLRLLQAKELQIDESILTGETDPVLKTTDIVQQADCPLGDRTNMAYMSTVVINGSGKGLVVRTGMQTEIGQIAKELKSNNSFDKTPLQKRLEVLAYVLFGFSLVLAVAVYGANRWAFETEVTLYAIAVAIAIIPEGMVAVVSITLAAGVQRLAKHKAIVKRLAALEALGQVTNICSDKTGTLTQAKMFAQSFWLTYSPKAVFTVTGIGVIPEGDILDSAKNRIDTSSLSEQMKQFMLCATICNSACVIDNTETPYALKNNLEGVKAVGEPTEVALAVMAAKGGYSKQLLTQNKEIKIVRECEFNHDLKKMSVYLLQKGKMHAYFKGAPERVLENCTHIVSAEDGTAEPLTAKKKTLFWKQNTKLAAQGLRVLALAYKLDLGISEKKLLQKSREDLEEGFVLLGLVGIQDPPRPQSRPAVVTCYNAGVSVHMATGDHPATAVSIAKKVAILKPDDPGLEAGGLAITAMNFDKMSDQEVDALSAVPKVIARCSPQSKVKLIQALHRQDKFVAMTGDGVNDAPALKKADIGIAMGQTGSDVTREVADVVLTDDNFATIVRAVAEGRRIFSNITKILIHLMTANVAEVVSLIIGLAIQDANHRSVYILSPLQILWLNMVTSSPPAIGLGMEKADVDVMQKPPRSKKRGMFTCEVLTDIFVYGIICGGLTLGSFAFVLFYWGGGQLGQNCNELSEASVGCEWVLRARATAFLIFNFLVLLLAFVCKSSKKSLFQTKLNDNMTLFWIVVVGTGLVVPTVYIPGVNQNVFKQGAIDQEWILVGVAVVAFVALEELYKAFKRCCLPKNRKFVVPWQYNDDEVAIPMKESTEKGRN